MGTTWRYNVAEDLIETPAGEIVALITLTVPSATRRQIGRRIEAAVALAEAHVAKVTHFAACHHCSDDDPDCLDGERAWRAEMDASIAYRAAKEA